MTKAKPQSKPQTNPRNPAGRLSGAASAPKTATAKSATRTKPAIVAGIAARPRALFDRHLKAILRSANEALVAVGDDLAKSCDVQDDDELSDHDVQLFYIARRIANLVLELGEIGEVTRYANDQHEFGVADELNIQLAVIGKRVVDLGDLYRALKKEAVNV